MVRRFVGEEVMIFRPQFSRIAAVISECKAKMAAGVFAGIERNARHARLWEAFLGGILL